MGHEYQDKVSLELARRVADGLRSHPEWMSIAYANLDRWRTQNASSPGLVRCYDEWQAILNRGTDFVVDTLRSNTDEGQRLRQNSPFIGIIAPSEVWAIKDRLKDEKTRT